MTGKPIAALSLTAAAPPPRTTDLKKVTVNTSKPKPQRRVSVMDEIAMGQKLRHVDVAVSKICDDDGDDDNNNNNNNDDNNNNNDDDDDNNNNNDDDDDDDDYGDDVVAVVVVVVCSSCL